MARKKQRKPHIPVERNTPSPQADVWTTAVEFYQAEKFQEAESLLLSLIEQSPQRADVVWLLATIAHRQGKLEKAIAFYQQAIALVPNYAEAYNNLGVIWQQQGQFKQAIESFQQAVKAKPDYLEAYLNLAKALIYQQNFGEAEEIYQQAIALQPNFESYYSLARIYQKQGNPLAAIPYYREALVCHPDSALAYNQLGSALREAGEIEEAITCHQQAISLKPDFADAYACLGFAFQESKRLDEAIVHYQQALEIKPNYPEILINLGAIFKDKNQLKEAIHCYQQALKYKPDFPEAYNNIGAALKDLDDYDQALIHYQKVLEFQPDNADAYRHIGNVLVDQGRLEEAIATYHQSLALNPNYAMTHSALATALLLQGKLPEGFAEYEWRWRTLELESRNFSQPQWKGSPLNGRTLLLYSEQGFGDMIQFIRYVPFVARLGGKIIVETYSPLIPLFQHIPGIDYLVAKGAPLPEFDVCAPLMSLPHILGTTLETIPGETPYLGTELKTAFSLPVSPSSTFKIGIAWSVNPESKTARRRACPLSYFLQLLEIPGVSLYSLQKGQSVQDLIGTPIHNLEAQLKDFADTAAVIAQLDLLITVDTAVGHLAGAMGKPAWVMLPFSSDWRWMLNREESPWYPTLRLFRQPQPQDWQAVFNQIKQELQAIVPVKSVQEFPAKTLVKSPQESSVKIPAASEIDSAIALHQQGCIAQGQGKLEEAIAFYRRSLSVNPNFVESYNNLAVALWNQGAYDEAIATYQQAITIKPDYADAYSNLGVALMSCDRKDEAIAAYRQAIALKPDYAEAYNNLGSVLRSTGALDEAIAAYEKALTIDPKCAEAYNNQGLVFFDREEFAQAIASHQQAINLKPNYAEAYDNWGRALQRLGRMVEAISCHQQAIALKPDYIQAYNRLGNALQQIGRFNEAIAIYQQAITLKPGYLDACNNLAATFCKAGKLQEAKQTYQQAIQIKSDDSSARFGYAFTLLIAGDFIPGFVEYEWRWHTEHAIPRNFSQPLWEGNFQPEKTLLLHAEQGLGDTLQFIRYAPLVKQKFGGKVILECQPPLVELLGTVPGIDQTIERGSSLPDFDVQIGLLSLPRIFATTLETIPVKVPYLGNGVLGIENKESPLSSPIPPLSSSPLKIGFVWAGFPSYLHDLTRQRSCELNHFLSLMDLPEIAWYSLQKEIPEPDQETVKKASFISLHEQLNDFSETAAHIAELDLIITIDTAVAHLAGAMGKPTWVLLPLAPDWRWMLVREDSPWYPSMRLFRQQQAGDWAEVFQRVRTALESLKEPVSLRLEDAIFQSQAGRFPQAESILRQLLKQQPDSVEVLHQLGIICCQTDRLTEGIGYYQRLLKLAPQYAEAHHNLGVALHKTRQAEAAKACYQESLRLKDNQPDAHNSLGVLLQEQGLLQEALSHYNQALNLREGYNAAYYNRGNVYLDLGRLSEAIADYNRVISTEPQHIWANWNRSLAQLLGGNFSEGFQGYEWRWQRLGIQPPYSQIPLWQGESLNGKTILLHAEQGFGDTIQFIRYLPLVVQRGGRVVVQCQPPLKRLLSAIPGVASLISTGDRLPAIDVQAPLLSLPKICATTLETIPAPLDLGHRASGIGHWALGIETGELPLFSPTPPLSSSPLLKVGMVWAGNASIFPNLQNQRNCPLAKFLELFDILGVELHSLQKELSESDRTLLAAYPQIQHYGDRLSDFQDTAEIIAQLDLIITIDTAVAHLAGTMGKPVWVLLPFSPDWRWMLKRTDSPWYPTMRLFRQTQPGNWQSVLTQVKVALQQFPIPNSPISNTPIANTPISNTPILNTPISTAAETLYQQGYEALQKRNLDPAIAYFQQALSQQPDFANAYYSLGVAFKQQGKFTEAITAYQHSIALKPDWVEAYVSLGIVLREVGRVEEAKDQYEIAIALSPNHPGIHNNLANALLALKRPQDAIAHYRQALASQPDYADVLINLGYVLQEQGEREEAITLYQKAITLEPNSVNAHCNLGVALQNSGRLTEAEKCYRQALALKPDFAIPYNNLGLIFQESDRFTEAIAYYQKAIALQPHYADAYHNLGVALMKQGVIQEAIASYQKAIALKPDFAQAHIGIAINLLLLGQFAEGFAEYEWRWQLAEVATPKFAQPLWDGSNLAGKTILLYSEQGFGDTINFIRFAPILKAQGATVFILCQKELIRLLQTTPGIDQLFAWGDPLLPFDVRAPLLSVPRLLGTTLETIPNSIPYIRNEELSSSLSLSPSPLLKVGIVWAGSPNHRDNRARSCGLQWFTPLLDVPGVQFYSLQKGQPVEELKTYNTLGKIIDLSEQITDFADTAALITQLDLVITVDTAVAHVAGALGKPVWICLCSYPDWRWLLDREDTPWYPSVRLFRQSRYGEWDEVFLQVKAALSQWVTEFKPVQNVVNKDSKKRSEKQTPTLKLQNLQATLETAVAYHQQGQFEEARSLYCKVADAQPERSEVWQLLGAVTCQMGKPEESLAYFQQALTLNPQYPDAYNNMGAAYWELGQLENAIANYQKAIELKPDYADAYNNWGTALRYQGFPEKAIAHYRKALGCKPDTAEVYNNMALAYRDLLQLDEAIANYQKAIEFKPDYSAAHTYKGLALLLKGDFTNGFVEYEWRWFLKTFAAGLSPSQFWEGSPLNGKTILLRAEQGFGDTLQFVRYAPQVKAKGGRVVLECQPQLKRLLANVPGIDQIVARGEEPLPSFDTQIPLLSLPRVLGTNLENIPAEIPYLGHGIWGTGHEALSPTLPPSSPPPLLKVGIVWAGSPKHQDDRNRSCGLTPLLPLLEVEGVAFYSLQKGERVTERVGIEQIIPLDEQLQDFADTAKAIAQLDLVITIDTSVAHLAGALGKPVWVLLCYSPDWRWLLNREDSPWYPTMRLFRQTQPGDWQGSCDRVKTALQALVETSSELQTQGVLPLTRSTEEITPPPAPAEVISAPVCPPSPITYPKAIGIAWSIGISTGWEVYGMNLTLQLLKTFGVDPLLLMPPAVNISQMNPLHRALLNPALETPPSVQQLLQQHPGKQLTFDAPVLHPLGNNFTTAPDIERLRGKQTLGVIFFEDTRLTPEAIAKAKTYDRIIAGSSWNAQVLKGYGLTRVETVLQGIDPTIFHPAPKSNLWGDRFVIFSGGKLEYRKGQDIIVAAFKQFQKRHPEALLLTAWHNFWPQFMLGIEQTGNVSGLPQVGSDKRLKITEWLVANGIPAEAVLDVGVIPNYLVGQIIREADVAVFTNRCEGGTNLAAMECLACGIPTLISANTGHLDLINPSHCYPLKTQNPVKQTPLFAGLEGWGESSVEEVIEWLEEVYNHREEAKHRGQLAAEFMQNLTWEKQVQRFIHVLSSNG